MKALLIILLACALASCQSTRRDFKEIDPYASYERTNDGDQIITVGGRMLLRDPGLTK